MATRRTRLASLFLTLVALTLSTFGLAAQNASSSLHRPDAGGRDAIASATPVVIALGLDVTGPRHRAGIASGAAGCLAAAVVLLAGPPIAFGGRHRSRRPSPRWTPARLRAPPVR